MVSRNLLLALVTVFALQTLGTGAQKDHCSNPDDRCVPLSYCPHIHNRTKAGEHRRNAAFKQEVLDSICDPTVKKETFHICCPKPKIECTLDGKPGVCLKLDQCPELKQSTEDQLMASPQKHLCYTLDQKNHFCCTTPHCVALRSFCDREPHTSIPLGESVFGKCPKKDEKYTLVPSVLCHSNKKVPSCNQPQAKRRVCCPKPKPSQLISHYKAKILAAQQCGVNGPVNKIQNGTHAQVGEFPWIAKLVYNDNAICSGTLIHPSYVLTAGHCITTNLKSVLLGIHNLNDKPPCGLKNRERCSRVQEIEIAEKFDCNTFDVGLLRLAQPATLDGNWVQPICLPLYASLRMYVPRSVTIAGWGDTARRNFPKTLMKAQTTVKDCAAKAHEICAGGRKDQNHCAGDSGGPYEGIGEFNGSNRIVQYAIISNGPNFCSKPQSTSRGVLVGYVIDWILGRMDL